MTLSERLNITVQVTSSGLGSLAVSDHRLLGHDSQVRREIGMPFAIANGLFQRCYSPAGQLDVEWTFIGIIADDLVRAAVRSYGGGLERYRKLGGFFRPQRGLGCQGHDKTPGVGTPGLN